MPADKLVDQRGFRHTWYSVQFIFVPVKPIFAGLPVWTPWQRACTVRWMPSR